MNDLDLLPKTASTLDEIEARLKEIQNGPMDVSKLPVVEHKITGISFRVAPLGRKDYDAWRKRRLIEDLRHKEEGGLETGADVDRENSQQYLLSKSLRDESGKCPSEALVKTLLNVDGAGPSNYLLISSAEAANPPRDQLVQELQLLMMKTTSDFVLMELLFKFGLKEVLLDKMSPTATPEEKLKAEISIEKVRAAQEGLAAFFNVSGVKESLAIEETNPNDLEIRESYISELEAQIKN